LNTNDNLFQFAFQKGVI
jgi:hypothetical protein